MNEYINNNGADLILLVKNIIYFYYEELEVYLENDKKIEKILNN